MAGKVRASGVVLRILPALGFIIAVGLAQPSLGPELWAQARPDRAEEANEQAKKLFKSGQMEEAAALWRRAFFQAEEETQLRISKNLGVAYYKLKRFEESYYFFSFFNVRCVDAERTRKVDKAISDLEAKLSEGRARVTVDTLPRDAAVYVESMDEPNRYEAPLVWYFSPGTHEVVVAAEGMQSRRETFTVEAGQFLGLEVSLAPVEKAAPVENAVPLRDERAESRPDTWGWIALGTGAALAAAGGTFLYLAMTDRDEIVSSAQDKIDQNIWTVDYAEQVKNDRFDEEVRPNNQLAVAFFIGGGLAAATGAVLLLMDGGDEESDTSVAFLPAGSPDTGAMVFQLTF